MKAVPSGPPHQKTLSVRGRPTPPRPCPCRRASRRSRRRGTNRPRALPTCYKARPAPCAMAIGGALARSPCAAPASSVEPSLHAAEPSGTAGPAAASGGRGRAASPTGAGDDVPTGGQAVDRGLHRGVVKVDPGMGAQFPPGGNTLAQAVADLQDAPIGVAAVVIGRHRMLPRVSMFAYIRPL